ncbi:MAG: HAMP domain-containing histidine kinase [Propionibacteriales bacterium]|nr:HAMP domain-containing histidine kinase [Propionibacteriales bacterium]
MGRRLPVGGSGVSRDTLIVIAIAAGWASVVGLCGLLVAYLIRRESLRWAFVTVALSGVLGLVAGAVGTAHAMFLSQHDFEVLLLVSSVAGVVSLGFALLVARWAIGGSRAVQEATRLLGEQGTFVVPADTPSELTALSAQLAETSGRLEESRTRERTLEGSRRELVAWVSHDLRTPLAGLRAMAEALEDGLAEDPARYHRQMRETVDNMTRMVDDLFELSRIHAGALALAVETIPLDEVISEVLASSSPIASARGVRLGGHAEPGVAVRADPRELGRLIGNLVTNAIRHTPSEGTVEVTGRAGPGGVELVVSDACGGIPGEDLDRVFEVAWRGSQARTPEARTEPGVDDRSAGSGSLMGTGSGLGLAIVRGIAEAHHGTVQVDNVGAGCRFLVRLPA